MTAQKGCLLMIHLCVISALLTPLANEEKDKAAEECHSHHYLHAPCSDDREKFIRTAI